MISVVIIVNENERKKIIPFASGKGGTGKTLISTNIAIRLAQQGRKVLFVDIDLGGSNAHTYLSIKNQHYGVANYIYNDHLSYDDIIQETAYSNLHFIAGDTLSPGIANIHSEQLEVVLREIILLAYDYIILDTASGSRSMSLGIFSFVNSGVMVMQPNIASVLNAYNFFKNVIFNIILRHVVAHDCAKASEYIHAILEEKKPNSTPKVNDVLLEIDRIDPQISIELREQIYCMKPFVILNGVRSANDLGVVRDLKGLIQKNMNIELECLGAIFEDFDSINKASQAHTPLICTELQSCAKDHIDRITQKILLSPDFPILPLDLEMYSDTIELTEIEIQHDKEQYSQDITALEREEYLARIESLQQRVHTLEKQSRAGKEYDTEESNSRYGPQALPNIEKARTSTIATPQEDAHDADLADDISTHSQRAEGT